MHHWEFSLSLITVLGLCIGSWSIYLVRRSHVPKSVAWGRRIFYATLALLGVSALLAASLQAFALTPLGLGLGALVIGALFDSPQSLPTISDGTDSLSS